MKKDGNLGSPERVALCLRVSARSSATARPSRSSASSWSEYCRLYGLEVAQVYADDGVSGTIPLHERPEGRRLLEDAEGGQVLHGARLPAGSARAVPAGDRRRPRQAPGRRCGPEERHGAHRHLQPRGRLIFQMLASFAEYERETIRERTQAGLHRAYRGGKHSGGALRLPHRRGRLPPGRAGRGGDRPRDHRERRRRLHALRGGQAPQRSGLPSPGWRYGNGKKRAGRKLWSVMTVSNIVRQCAYSGVQGSRPTAARTSSSAGASRRRAGPPGAGEGRARREQAVPRPGERSRLPARGPRPVRGLRRRLHGPQRGSRARSTITTRARAAKTYNFGAAPPHKAPT